MIKVLFDLSLRQAFWRKIHIGIDKKTPEICAIEATSGSIADALLLPDLNQMPPDERSKASRQTVHTINANVTILLRLSMHVQSFHPVKTLSYGSLIRPVRGRQTKLSDPQNIWAVRCGGS